MDREAIQDNIYSALSHDIRRRIIYIIGKHGVASYTDMKVLNLEPGTLYFHIDVLVKSDYPLVKRNKEKQYSLTDVGQSAYKILEQGEDGLYWLEEEKGSIKTPSSMLAMSPVVKRVQSDPWRFWLDLLLFLAGYGYLSYMVGLIPVGLFFLEGVLDPGLTIFAAFLAWLSTFILVEIISAIVLGTRRPSSAMFMSLPITFIPYILIELVLQFVFSSGTITGWLLTLFLIIPISWSCYVLTMSLARARNVRPSRAAIVTLIVTNVNLILLAIIS